MPPKRVQIHAEEEAGRCLHAYELNRLPKMGIDAMMCTRCGHWLEPSAARASVDTPKPPSPVRPTAQMAAHQQTPPASEIRAAVNDLKRKRDDQLADTDHPAAKKATNVATATPLTPLTANSMQSRIERATHVQLRWQEHLRMLSSGQCSPVTGTAKQSPNGGVDIALGWLVRGKLMDAKSGTFDFNQAVTEIVIFNVDSPLLISPFGLSSMKDQKNPLKVSYSVNGTVDRLPENRIFEQGAFRGTYNTAPSLNPRENTPSECFANYIARMEFELRAHVLAQHAQWHADLGLPTPTGDDEWDAKTIRQKWTKNVRPGKANDKRPGEFYNDSVRFNVPHFVNGETGEHVFRTSFWDEAKRRIEDPVAQLKPWCEIAVRWSVPSIWLQSGMKTITSPIKALQIQRTALPRAQQDTECTLDVAPAPLTDTPQQGELTLHVHEE